MKKLTDKEFDKIVKRAIHRIPFEIRKHLDNVQISVLSRPSRKMLEEMDLPRHETLLGLFWGVPLREQSITTPPLFPATIFIFHEPLQEICETIDELEKQIEITVVHEIAHAIGIDEDRLSGLGYG
jgi:predicted Zn-dependent protease with MMP-like domain